MSNLRGCVHCLDLDAAFGSPGAHFHLLALEFLFPKLFEKSRHSALVTSHRNQPGDVPRHPLAGLELHWFVQVLAHGLVDGRRDAGPHCHRNGYERAAVLWLVCARLRAGVSQFELPGHDGRQNEPFKICKAEIAEFASRISTATTWEKLCDMRAWRASLGLTAAFSPNSTRTAPGLVDPLVLAMLLAEFR